MANDDYVVEAYEHKDKTINIVFDPEPQSPREWDNLGEMVHWHDRYILGDRKLEDDEYRAMSRGGFPLLQRYMRMCKGAVSVLPLSIYDHSMVSMWVGRPYTDSYRGWDSSFIGFIYTTKEAIEKMGTPEDRVEKVLRAEVEDFNSYLTGQIFGFEILDKDGHEEDSCFGFYSAEDAKQEAESYL